MLVCTDALISQRRVIHSQYEGERKCGVVWWGGVVWWWGGVMWCGVGCWEAGGGAAAMKMVSGFRSTSVGLTITLAADSRAVFPLL